MQTFYFDRLTKVLMLLKIADKVFEQNMRNKIWEPAIVISKNNPKSDKDRTTTNQVYTRNHLRPLKAIRNPSYVTNSDFENSMGCSDELENSANTNNNVENSFLDNSNKIMKQSMDVSVDDQHI
ncbi:hypothetical protein NPIL_473671 [Nephila pilipes]|uniref:Uncharacterized protein n=1 Tax=Nephila pilipes TaxID=299642 RepID=A0A8X6TB59_NEPPI|nr:hypothetical protein NPIL_473671 [Nephila pilipes]